MGDSTPTQPPPLKTNPSDTVPDIITPPGQQTAPSGLTNGRRGYVLWFEFTPLSLASSSSREARPDTFNAVEALRSLADALFTSQGEVIIHDWQNQHTFTNLSNWPTTNAVFCSYFDVHVPTTGKTTAFVRFPISTVLEYKQLKQDGILYNYLQSNSIYLTIQQF
ncbi:hypothetical protein ACA910_012393 [Epithemia clementina (nom. ined.)]